MIHEACEIRRLHHLLEYTVAPGLFERSLSLIEATQRWRQLPRHMHA